MENEDGIVEVLSCVEFGYDKNTDLHPEGSSLIGMIEFDGVIIDKFDGDGDIPMVLVAKREDDGSYSLAPMTDEESSLNIFVPIINTNNNKVTKYIDDIGTLLPCVLENGADNYSSEDVVDDIDAMFKEAGLL